MENKKKKSIKYPKLGRGAERLLLLTLPIVLLQAIYITVFVAGSNTYEIAKSVDAIRLMLERMGGSLLLSVLGSLFFDMLEKREKKE